MQSPLYSAEALRDTLPSVRVLDARPSPAAYETLHVAGAIHADLNKTLSAASDPGADPVHGGRHPLPSPTRFLAQLAAWGIRPETTVVIYDDLGGANAASRAWWMLKSVGHDKAYVLDGGLAAAIEAGVPMSRDVPSIEACPDAGSSGATWKLPTATIDEVAARATAPEWKVLDVRSAERFRGDSETLDPTPGHIPGARNLFFGANLGENGKFRSPGALRAEYETLLAGTPPERLIVHCGSGVTACHTLLALDVAGLPGASLYVGSWSEWCRSGRPQAKGGEGDR